MKKQRIALVGTGGRGISFVEPVVGPYSASNELVALCDLSPTRLAYYNELLAKRWSHPAVPTYPADQFSRMIAEQRPDRVIICTIDRTHADYIVRSLEAGCDVITEKPMTIDEASCLRIMEAIQRTGRQVRVAFNYRWGIFRTKVKEALAEGRIGRVKSVNLEYLLDTSHGADYFRRWHSQRADSGGLLVHKSTHHFDLVNWWLDAIPEQVYAHGDLVYYGRQNAVARGDEAWTAYPRYTGADTKGDPFALDLNATESFRRLYRDAEADTGYLRDRNVFRDGIDIPDQMNALVRYRTGEVLNYSLIAFSPREGMRVTFNGDRGRLEYNEFTGSHMNRAVVSDEFRHEHHGSAEAEGEWVRIFPHFAPSYLLPVPAESGPHGGADRVMVEQLFSPTPPADPWSRTAGHEQGAASILVGISANRSIETGRPVRLDERVPLRPGARRLSELI
ncbi:MAG: Gfo/Idh/MocA family oxidoreductase [Opitutaceae bacterium]|nr:Gfo/Idh/MocA family oxidoreductase [Opitutaceae bacterium]